MDETEDLDDDNDGFPDAEDDLPLDSNEWSDNDLDGIGDNSDTDDDNDGSSDSEEEVRKTSPTDSDSDDDGFMDGVDDFPLNPSEWTDSDGDGVGDNGDAFPNDPDRQVEEDSMAMLIFVGSVATIIVLGLGGWLVMRKKGDDDDSSYFQKSSVDQSDDTSYDASTTLSNVSVPDRISPRSEEITPHSTLVAPSDAKLNENGQLVWVDGSGNVYCQNPDGSILTFDSSTGSWGPI